MSLSAKSLNGTSKLDAFRQSGSLKAMFPRIFDTTLQAVLVNTAGGVTGGDRFRLEATAGAKTHLTLTTQTSERAYRAQPDETGEIRSHLTVKSGSRLNWLPQETILFQGSALNRSLTVDMDETAQLLLVEPMVFGRAAMGERLTNANVRDRIEIRRAGTPLYLDAITMNGDIAEQLARPTIAGGAGAMASLVYVAPDAEAQLSPLRAMLPDSAGASLINDDLLAIRAVAEDSYVLRQFLVPILNCLTSDALPRTWMI